ncbi:hypothetical protein PHISP_02768 [Aspergillus sp. HF37]|nr:hypothetical protein PHISP_02768 [Aspergillus sp. HF37]
MNNEHDNRPNPLNQHPISPSFLFYSTLCIVCILVSFRHIKALRHRSRHRHRRGVHCKSLPPERQTMASSSSQAGGEHGELEKGQPVSDSAIHHRHPSACDILQPLSHLVPVPASGHVAAAVAAGAAEKASATTSPRPGPNLSPYLPPPPKQDSQQPSRMDAEPNSAGPGAGAGAIDPHHRPHCCHPVENPSSTNPPSSSSHIHNPAVPVPSAPSVPAVGTSGPGVAVHSTLPAEGFCHPIQPQQNPNPGPAPAENAPHGVQKRTETAQFCRDVDAEGIRSWRRLIVEYG